MSYPTKPAFGSGYDTNVSFAYQLQSAWLANEGSGVTLTDYGPAEVHLIGTNVSDGSWIDKGTDQLVVKCDGGSRFWNITNATNLQTTGDYTLTVWLTTADLNGTKAMMLTRENNIPLWVFDPTTRANEFLQAVWLGGGTTSSGAIECWQWVWVDSEARVITYRNGIEQSNRPGMAQGFDAGNQITLMGPYNNVTNVVDGEFIMAFVHHRALTPSEVYEHATDPEGTLGFTAGGGSSTASYVYSDPNSPQYTSVDNTFNPIPMASRDFGFYGSDRRGGQSHILDWIGGGW